MKRTIFLSLLCLTLGLMLTGCASSADPEPTPGVGMGTPGPSPMASTMPSATEDGGLLGDVKDMLDGDDDRQKITTAEEALRVSGQVRDAVQKLTEVDTATAVALGDTALVGVTFDSSYKGDADDRLRGMVLERAQAIHPGIRNVAVATDKGVIDEIAKLYQMLQNGTGYATVKANADTLVLGLELFGK